jgi:transcriptional regulator with XRE-family HTH domain
MLILNHMPRGGIPINGAAVQAIRERTGYSGAELAEKAGIDRTYLIRIERGERQHVSPPIARRLAEALGVPLGAVLGVADAAEGEAS